MSDGKEQILYLLDKHPKISRAGLSLATGRPSGDIERILQELHCTEDIHYEDETITLRRKEYQRTEPHLISEIDYVLHAFLQHAPKSVLGDIALKLELSRDKTVHVLTAHEARGLVEVNAGVYTTRVNVPIRTLHVRRDLRMLSLETPEQYQYRKRRENRIALLSALAVLFLLYLVPKQLQVTSKADVLQALNRTEGTLSLSGMNTLQERRARLQKEQKEQRAQQLKSCERYWLKSPQESCIVAGEVYTKRSWADTKRGEK